MKMGPSYKIYIYIYINHNWLKLTSIISLSCLTSERKEYEKIQIYLGASRRRSNKTVTVTDRRVNKGEGRGKRERKNSIKGGRGERKLESPQ